MNRIRLGMGCGLVFLVLQATASAQWFTDTIDTYYTGTCDSPFCGCTADETAFASAGWTILPGAPAYTDGVITGEYLFKSCGDPTGPTFMTSSPPFHWRQTKLEPDRVYRSLIPAIIAASGNPSMNAVNATEGHDLVIHFHMGLGNVGKQDGTTAWLELFAGPVATMSAPVRVPDAGTCTAGVCVGGPMDSQACTTNDTCTAMKLQRNGSIDGNGNLVCTLLDSTPALARPSIAYGVFGGENGLVPKPPCTNFINRLLTHPVIYDGNQWWQMKNGSPAGSTGDEFANGMGDINITITIHTTTIDVTASYYPTQDAKCTANVCTGGGPNAGLSCTRKSDCQPYFVSTKTGIPRQYLGPFQAIAIGSGPVFDGTTTPPNPYTGSQYSGFFDDIEITGGEFLQLGVGACCQASDGTCSEVPQETCEQVVGRTYFGDGTTCATVACGTGACCLQNGTCSVTDPGTCSSQNGAYSGNATVCSNVSCCPHGPYVWADKDADNDVDMDDFAAFQRCYTGAAGGVPAGCSCFDRASSNPSGIDTADFTAFTNCVTGPSIPWSLAVAPSCVP